MSDGLICNNFIAGEPDCGIELWYADRIRVFSNTIWRPERNWNQGIRIGASTTQTEIAGNLVHGGIDSAGGDAQLHDNLTGHLDGYFVDPASGKLVLTSLGAMPALSRGTAAFPARGRSCRAVTAADGMGAFAIGFRLLPPPP